MSDHLSPGGIGDGLIGNSQSPIETIALRLLPGADIRRDLENLAKKEHISAAVILGAVGSLSQANLRYAGQDEHTALAGKQEILTLSGMLSSAGVHLHMSVSNAQGECRGGHVVYGCLVYTTLEIAITLIPQLEFQRVPDAATGFKELKIVPKSGSKSGAGPAIPMKLPTEIELSAFAE